MVIHVLDSHSEKFVLDENQIISLLFYISRNDRSPLFLNFEISLKLFPKNLNKYSVERKTLYKMHDIQVLSRIIII